VSDNAKKAAKWIPAYVAFNRLRKQYEAAEVFADEEVCFRVAADTLIRRLRAGQLPSRAAHCHLYEEAPPPDDEKPQSQKTDIDGYHMVPASFWASFSACRAQSREQDWISGDFEFHEDSEFFGHGGSVIGLELDERHLPLEPLGSLPLIKGNESELTAAKAGGRPPAKWWADFAEELAVYVHENGLPEGKGHEGQSEVIDAIFARMNERGKKEPGRPTVQPVINAVLRRIRSAGN
jgi:hypothetical protein